MDNKYNFNSKIVFAKKKEDFTDRLAKADPEKLSELSPLVFIEETQEVWLEGTYFSVGSPGVTVTEKDSIINVDIGPNGFTLSSAGDNITIRKGSGNNIVISSSALTSVDTNYPLEWDPTDKKLLHNDSGVNPGNYGQLNESDNVNLLTLPYITVDKWGHLTNIENKNIKIRDYVEQLNSPITSGKYNILLGYSGNPETESQPVRKADGLTFDPTTKELEIEGGVKVGGNSSIEGDLIVTEGQIIGDVQGDITGVATPKIHLSEDPEYGGASLHLYGHVKLQDKFNGVPAPSSDNEDPDSNRVTNGVAASPRMVWDTKEELEGKIIAAEGVKAITVNGVTAPKSTFREELKITTEGGLGGGIDPLTGEIVLKSTLISGKDENKNTKYLQEELEFTDDFQIEDGKKVSLRWENIE